MYFLSASRRLGGQTSAPSTCSDGFISSRGLNATSSTNALERWGEEFTTTALGESGGSDRGLKNDLAPRLTGLGADPAPNATFHPLRGVLTFHQAVPEASESTPKALPDGFGRGG